MSSSDTPTRSSGRASLANKGSLPQFAPRSLQIQTVEDELIEVLSQSGLLQKLAADVPHVVLRFLVKEGADVPQDLDEQGQSRFVADQWEVLAKRAQDPEFYMDLLMGWHAQQFLQLTEGIGSPFDLEYLRLAKVFTRGNSAFYWRDILFARLCKPGNAGFAEVLRGPFADVLRNADSAVGRAALPNKHRKYWVTWLVLQAVERAIETLNSNVDNCRVELFKQSLQLERSASEPSPGKRRRRRRVDRGDADIEADDVASWADITGFVERLKGAFGGAQARFREQAAELCRLICWLDIGLEDSVGGISLTAVNEWSDAELALFLDGLAELGERVRTAFDDHLEGGQQQSLGEQVVLLVDRIEPQPPDHDYELLRTDVDALDSALEEMPLGQAMKKAPLLHALATICLDLGATACAEPWKRLKMRLSYYFVEGLEDERYSWEGGASNDQKLKEDREPEENAPTEAEPSPEAAAEAIQDEVSSRSAEQQESVATSASSDVFDAHPLSPRNDEQVGVEASVDSPDDSMAQPSVDERSRANDELGGAESSGPAEAPGEVPDPSPSSGEGESEYSAADSASESVHSGSGSVKSEGNDPIGVADTLERESSEVMLQIESLSAEELAEHVSAILSEEKDYELPAYGVLAEQQKRWLLAGQNLRGLLVARYNEEEQHSTAQEYKQVVALMPSWLCWIAIRISDPNAHLVDSNFGDLTSNIYMLEYEPQPAHQFALAWLCVGLLSEAVEFALAVAKVMPPTIFEESWAQESPFYHFCVTRLLEPAQKGRQPQMTAERPTELLERDCREHLERAEAAIDSGRANYQNTLVKRFWRALVNPKGRPHRLWQEVKQGNAPASWPTPSQLAGGVENWDKVVAHYRSNILNRLSTFLEELRHAAKVQASIANREARKENVLNASAVEAAVADGRDVLKALMQERSPSAYPIRLLLSRLESLEPSHEA